MEFRPVPGYEGIYEISDTGEVWSCERLGANGQRLHRKRLTGGVYPNGYRFVCLRKDGVNRQVLTHRLVAMVYVPNPSSFPEVNHINSDRADNGATNLEWCTRKYNHWHSVIYGNCKWSWMERPVEVTKDGLTRTFPNMARVCELFGHTKRWLGNLIRKRGNPCEYNGYTIYVHESR